MDTTTETIYVSYDSDKSITADQTETEIKSHNEEINDKLIQLKIMVDTVKKEIKLNRKRFLYDNNKKHRETLVENAKKWNKSHREEINEKRKFQIRHCECCNVDISNHNFSTHLKSNKHTQNNLIFNLQKI